ncbi:unnamed protein product [Moneuplotes crassus]|uniref:Uncharacterized protein n=1 Tax=Euplotes crassus TaxID=5936 RepID=A0AAD1XDK5_EUPCR|nr:unnamed protein product [Moneuplotes crassus]
MLIGEKLLLLYCNKTDKEKKKKLLTPYNMRKYKNQRRAGVSAAIAFTFPFSKKRSNQEPVKPIRPTKKRTTLTEITDTEENKTQNEIKKRPIIKKLTKKYETSNSFIKKKESFNRFIISLKESTSSSKPRRQSLIGTKGITQKDMIQPSLESYSGRSKPKGIIKRICRKYKDIKTFKKSKTRNSFHLTAHTRIDNMKKSRFANQKAKDNIRKESTISSSDLSISEFSRESNSIEKTVIQKQPMKQKKPKLMTRSLIYRKPVQIKTRNNSTQKLSKPRTRPRTSRKPQTLTKKTLRKSYRLDYFPWDLFIAKS